MPISRQVGQDGGFVSRDGSLGPNGKMNPAAATWTLPREADVSPPSTNQRIVNRRSIGLNPKVHGLHALATARVGAGFCIVNDMRRHATFLSSLAIGIMHAFELFGCRSRQGQ